MAITTTISQNEMQRIAALAYEGKVLSVMLCSVGSSGYTAESSVADWQSVEVATANGYQRFTATVGVGAFNANTGRYELPVINASFTATSAGYSYDRIVMFIGNSATVHSVLSEDPNIVLSAGQTQTYKLTLITDD